MGLIPSPSAYGRQPIDASLTSMILSLPLSLKAMKKPPWVRIKANKQIPPFSEDLDGLHFPDPLVVRAGPMTDL